MGLPVTAEQCRELPQRFWLAPTCAVCRERIPVPVSVTTPDVVLIEEQANIISRHTSRFRILRSGPTIATVLRQPIVEDSNGFGSKIIDQRLSVGADHNIDRPIVEAVKKSRRAYGSRPRGMSAAVARSLGLMP